MAIASDHASEKISELRFSGIYESRFENFRRGLLAKKAFDSNGLVAERQY